MSLKLQRTAQVIFNPFLLSVSADYYDRCNKTTQTQTTKNKSIQGYEL